jgi:hypothetical protein
MKLAQNPLVSLIVALAIGAVAYGQITTNPVRLQAGWWPIHPGRMVDINSFNHPAADEDGYIHLTVCQAEEVVYAVPSGNWFVVTDLSFHNTSGSHVDLVQDYQGVRTVKRGGNWVGFKAEASTGLAFPPGATVSIRNRDCSTNPSQSVVYHINDYLVP